jgi:hypothetical protein
MCYVPQKSVIKTKTVPIFCPVHLFIDATLADRIGCLKVEPVLCLFGNICGKKRQNASAWFILGFIPPYPKSSIESQADHRREETKHLHMEYYHACMFLSSC